MDETRMVGLKSGQGSLEAERGSVIGRWRDRQCGGGEMIIEVVLEEPLNEVDIRLCVKSKCKRWKI